MPVTGICLEGLTLHGQHSAHAISPPCCPRSAASDRCPHRPSREVAPLPAHRGIAEVSSASLTGSLMRAPLVAMAFALLGRESDPLGDTGRTDHYPPLGTRLRFVAAALRPRYYPDGDQAVLMAVSRGARRFDGSAPELAFNGGKPPFCERTRAT